MNEPSGPTPLETLNAGADLQVTLLDGTPDSVRLRQLAIGDCEKLLLASGDEIALACLYTGKDRAWFEGLDALSQERVVVEGDRINLDFFGRWFQRRLERQERLMPGSTEKLLTHAMAPEAPVVAPRFPSPSLPPPPVRSRA